ncbi:MAG: hypothetical protein KDC12_09920, partial [Flavobacteriales bacterium]|nr:hypothetical protein [Flavobacteriales bacterium]
IGTDHACSKEVNGSAIVPVCPLEKQGRTIKMTINARILSIGLERIGINIKSLLITVRKSSENLGVRRFLFVISMILTLYHYSQ